MVYFVRLIPAEKLQNSKWESPEMNSYGDEERQNNLAQGRHNSSIAKEKEKECHKA
jgi:hypothetical protein